MYRIYTTPTRRVHILRVHVGVVYLTYYYMTAGV